MTTPYEVVFDSFLSKIDDDLYANLMPDDAEEDFLKLLNSAVVHFTFPKVNINDRDDNFQQFNVELSIYEIEIISTLMKLEWVKRQINSIKLLRQMIGSKDFTLTSQANHLKVLLELKNDTQSESEKLMTKYSYTSDRSSLYKGLSSDD